MQPYLKAYDKNGKLLATGHEVVGDRGSVIIANLAPHTTYPEGSFFISWQAEQYETEKVVVPEFTTHESTYKEFAFYFKDHIVVKTKTAYDLAVDNGFTGTEAEWVASIKGEKGDPGEDGSDGVDGDSAYEVALGNGFEGSEAEWLKTLKGEKGDDFDENVFDEKIKPITEKINTLSNTLYENNVISDVEAENIFVEEMNKKIIQLGCTSTKFLNSTGLTAAGQLSTAYDFNILTLHASGYREIANIWGQKSYNMKIEGINPRTILTETTVTSPSIDDYYKVLGGKTGTVGFIRNVTTVIYDKGSIYIATIMKGTTDRYNDLKTAIDEAIKKEKGEEYDITLVGDENTAFSILKHPNVEPYLLTNNKPEILLSNKEAVKQNPASMTKIVTAMIMLENIGNINQTIKFKESDFVGGSGISLGVGDVMTFRDALYAMLLSSSNDTAKAVARVVGHNIYFNRNKNNVTT